MTLRERMLAVYHRKNPDRIPWAAYGMLIPRGKVGFPGQPMGCLFPEGKLNEN